MLKNTNKLKMLSNGEKDKINRIYGFYPESEFYVNLEREQSRADRNLHHFSLVIISNQDHTFNGNGQFNLARILAFRIRKMDYITWYKEDSFAVFLPYTEKKAADMFANDADTLFKNIGGKMNFNVYSYPSDGMDFTKNNNKPDISDISDWEKKRKVWDATGAMDWKNSDIAVDSEYTPNIEDLVPYSIPKWKRFMDIFGAAAGILLLSPAFITIAAFIKIVSPGPVFFKQERIGIRGEKFTFWKFRSMHVNSDTNVHKKHYTEFIHQDVPMQKLDAQKDSRIIPLGNILRESCLDELPQLFNVLKGEMSLIGPRPCLPYEAEQYLNWHKKRFYCLPGMTGSWQINGKNKTTFKEMIRMDISYAHKHTFWGDVKILLKTFPAIISMFRENVNVNGEGKYA